MVFQNRAVKAGISVVLQAAGVQRNMERWTPNHLHFGLKQSRAGSGGRGKASTDHLA